MNLRPTLERLRRLLAALAPPEEPADDRPALPPLEAFRALPAGERFRLLCEHMRPPRLRATGARGFEEYRGLPPEELRSLRHERTRQAGRSLLDYLRGLAAADLVRLHRATLGR
jgi:hypothetical protein